MKILYTPDFSCLIYNCLTLSDPCLNGGTCLDLIGNYQCQCVSGFGGQHCQTDIDECASNPCQNGGTCQDYVNSFTCSCRPGFSGTHCQDNNEDCTSRFVCILFLFSFKQKYLKYLLWGKDFSQKQHFPFWMKFQCAYQKLQMNQKSTIQEI